MWAGGRRAAGDIRQDDEADQSTHRDDRDLGGRRGHGQRGEGRGHDHDRARHVGWRVRHMTSTAWATTGPPPA